MTIITYDVLIDRLNDIGETTTQSNIAHFFSVKQATVSRWKKNNSLPQKYYNILKLKEIEKPNESTTSQLIETIVKLKNENKKLKQQIQPQTKIKKLLGDMYKTHHSECEVSFKFEGMSLQRKINWVEGKKECSRFLGYSVKELEEHYWHIDKWFSMSSHPIENIIQKSSISTFKDNARLLFEVGSVYIKNKQIKPFEITQEIVYLHKKGHNVPATLELKAKFTPKFKAIIKTSFI